MSIFFYNLTNNINILTKRSCNTSKSEIFSDIVKKSIHNIARVIIFPILIIKKITARKRMMIFRCRKEINIG